jgi:hypothetical protein
MLCFQALKVHNGGDTKTGVAIIKTLCNSKVNNTFTKGGTQLRLGWYFHQTICLEIKG